MPQKQKNGKKRVILTIAGIFSIFLLVVICAAILLFHEEIKIISSIRKVSEETPFYYMEIGSDYHFQEFLDSGGASSDKEISSFLTNHISKGFYAIDVTESGPACSLISAVSEEGSHVWGRNYDWDASIPIIVRCEPKDGYASIATCDLQNITNDPDTRPDTLADKMLAIAALYVPVDGMNEAGLCVADLEVNEGGMKEVDTDKPDLTITTATRLILNKAATVEEAIHLLEQYDIHASGGISHHLAVSDAAGASTVLEFVDGEMISVPADYATNFNLAVNDSAAGGASSQKRYDSLAEVYKKNEGILTQKQVEDALLLVSQDKGEWTTQWSIVYNQKTRTADYWFQCNSSKKYHYSLEE